MRHKCLFLLLNLGLAGFAGRAWGAATEKTELKRFSLWVQPLALVMTIPRGFSVPLGANVRLGEKATLGLELTYLQRQYYVDYKRVLSNSYWPDSLNLLGSIGPVFQLTGQIGESGFFVQPKLLVVYSKDATVSDLNDGIPSSPSNPDEYLGGDILNVQLAVDVGYQFVWRHFFFATLLGLGGGYGFNVQWAGFPIDSLLAPSPRPRSSRPTFSVNVNLFRLGFTF